MTLSKKESKQRIEKTAWLMDAGYYDMAMAMHYSADTLYTSKKLPADTQSELERVNHRLSDLKFSWDQTRKQLHDALLMMDENKYCDAIKTLPAHQFEPLFSDASTRRLWESKREELNRIRKECDENQSLFNEYASDFADGAFDKLYFLLEDDDTLIRLRTYLQASSLAEFNLMMETVSAVYKLGKSLLEETSSLLDAGKDAGKALKDLKGTLTPLIELLEKIDD